MKTSFWIGLTAIGIGLILVAIPDTGAPLIQFNAEHGPSALDVVGLALIVVTWLVMVIKTVVERQRVVQHHGTDKIKRLLGYVVLGGASIFFGLQIELDFILWCGVLVSLLGYGLLFLPAFRKSA